MGMLHRMQPSSSPSTLAALIEEQRALEDRICRSDLGPEDALAAGRALLEFAEREGDAFSVLSPLLDPVAHAELATEHRQIADDLELLEWLLTSSPDSPDVAVLSTAVGRRMQQHIARDGRLLARAAGLSGR